METLFAALIGGLIGSVAGAAIAGFVAFRLSRTERRQERKAATYVDMLTALLREQNVIGETEPDVVITGSERSATVMPTPEELGLLSAKIGAFGSDEVKRQLRAIQVVGHAFFAQVWIYRQLGGGDPALMRRPPGQKTDEVMKAWEGFRAKREEFGRLYKQLEERVASELEE